MPRLRPFQLLLQNLEGKISPDAGRHYRTKERALAELKQQTGQDFGDDVEAWRRWLRENGLR